MVKIVCYALGLDFHLVFYFSICLRFCMRKVGLTMMKMIMMKYNGTYGGRHHGLELRITTNSSLGKE